VAAWNSVLMEYNKDLLEVLPINEKTWNMKEDEEFILSLEENAALLVVHNLGNIVNVPRIKSLRPDLIIVEDNCEGIFGKYDNIYSGCSEKTLCSAVSFYGNKTVTTGEGGAFLTNDDEVYNYIKKVYSQGMSSKRYVHDVHAYNYRMTNIQAAFLYDQLSDIDAILQRKKSIFDTYDELLGNLKNENKIKLQKVSNNTNRANWMYALRIVNNTKTPEETFEIFKSMGIETRPFFYSFEHHEHLKNLKCNSQLDSNLSNLLNREIIMIPSSPMISKEEQFKVVESICQFITFLNT
jgi:perosamine synthetase